jgi:hypothetical protein
VRGRFALAACMLLLAACGQPDSAAFPPPGEASDASGATDQEFFDFAAPRLGGGGQVTGAELQGKDVALWFWAPW